VRPGPRDTAIASYADAKLAEARRRIRAIADSPWRLSDGGRLDALAQQVREIKEIRSLMNAALYLARETARAHGIRIPGR